LEGLISWFRNGVCISAKSFLFSITSCAKYDCTNTTVAISNYHDHGLLFGNSDLMIVPDFLSHNNSCTKSSYAIPDPSNFTGATKFQLVEIEVYTIDRAPDKMNWHSEDDYYALKKEISIMNQMLERKVEKLKEFEQELSLIRGSFDLKLRDEKLKKEQADRAAFLEERLAAKNIIDELKKSEENHKALELAISQRIEKAKEELTRANRSRQAAKENKEKYDQMLREAENEYQKIAHFKDKNAQKRL